MARMRRRSMPMRSRFRPTAPAATLVMAVHATSRKTNAYGASPWAVLSTPPPSRSAAHSGKPRRRRRLLPTGPGSSQGGSSDTDEGDGSDAKDASQCGALSANEDAERVDGPARPIRSRSIFFSSVGGRSGMAGGTRSGALGGCRFGTGGNGTSGLNGLIHCCRFGSDGSGAPGMNGLYRGGGGKAFIGISGNLGSKGVEGALPNQPISGSPSSLPARFGILWGASRNRRSSSRKGSRSGSRSFI